MWWLIILLIVLMPVAAILDSKIRIKQKNNRFDSISKKLRGIDNFKISRQVNGFGGLYIFAIDETNKKIGFVTELERTIINF